MRVVLHTKARAELRAAALWYDEQRPGLGRELVAEVPEIPGGHIDGSLAIGKAESRIEQRTTQPAARIPVPEATPPLPYRGVRIPCPGSSKRGLVVNLIG